MVISAASLVVGLATYGYNVTRCGGDGGEARMPACEDRACENGGRDGLTALTLSVVSSSLRFS